ncbi:MAG: putative bifunctional diguanylate cyclase/phosphodiesterase [Clostridium sp.]
MSNKDVLKPQEESDEFIFKHWEAIGELKRHSKDTYFKWDLSKKEVTIFGTLSRIIAGSGSSILKITEDKWLSLIDEEKVSEYISNINKSIECLSEFNGVIKLNSIYNTPIWLEMNLKVINNEDNISSVLFGYMHDISNQKELEQEYRKVIQYDGLTGLPTKHHMKTIVDYYLDKSKTQRGALIIIDIDNFKYINESFGHSEGDWLLKEIAVCLSSIINDEDVICRYSGDEFIVFKPYITSIEEAESISQKLLECIETPKLLAGQKVYITASVGVAIFPDNGEGFDDLLKNADAATHRAKANGKNIYDIFDKSISNEIERTYLIHKGLRTAIQNEELFVMFQPKVMLSDCKVNGFEALLRWDSKELGVVSPVEFIPIAESTRLILPIGRFVFEEVFKKIKHFLNDGYDNFKIAVNVSEVQLRYDNIIDDLEELIAEYDVPPKYIEIEITESVLMKSFDKNIHRLEKIKNLGISIALDDFGTGYSSLNYLTKLPIDVLKIDRSFVMDLFKNPKNRCIVENIINLSHELGIEVVAEGVEELEQIYYLKSICCDIVQGYYYSKPETFDNISSFLGRRILVNINN